MLDVRCSVNQSNWQNHAALERAFARLEKDLRTRFRQTTARQAAASN
jgi:glycine cleavage system regulatory protein